MFPIHPSRRRVQHRPTLPKADVDERFVFILFYCSSTHSRLEALLMLSIIALSAFNIVVLLAPPKFLSSILELMTLPTAGRATLLIAVVVNVALSMIFEKWGAPAVAELVGYVLNLRRRRVRDGKTYKAIENGIR